MKTVLQAPPLTWKFTASPHEYVTRSGYRWHNGRRGSAPQVILQRTFAGEGRFRAGRKVHRVGPEALFIGLVPEDAEYWYEPGSGGGWRFHWLNLQGAFAVTLWGQLRQQFGAVVDLPDDSAAAHAMTRLIADVDNGRLGNVPLAAEQVYAFFVTTWTQLEGHETGVTPPVQRLRELIRSRFREPVNIKELCGEVGLSREHLSREFRRIYGQEPGAYLRRLRLEAAETFLQQTLLSLDEVAARTGLGGGHQLARFFRQQTGRTPAEFREAAQGSGGSGRAIQPPLVDRWVRDGCQNK